MAERLAPVQEALRISSRPERPRGRARRFVRQLLALVIGVAVLVATALVTLHFLAIQRPAHEVRATALVPPEMAASILVVLARPGQELPMAGTLASLDRAGARVSVLALTRGEAHEPTLAIAADRLGAIRADELAQSGEVLGADEVSTLGYADGQVLAADPDEVTAAISKAIGQARPSVVLTVSDSTGADTDSQAAAAYTLLAAQAEGSGVARVWTVTRGDRELSWMGRVADATALPASGSLPKPQIAVRIDDETAVKGEVLLAHGTQSPVLVQATYPYADRIPAQAYFRFWDREYFALAWGQPLG